MKIQYSYKFQHWKYKHAIQSDLFNNSNCIEICSIKDPNMHDILREFKLSYIIVDIPYRLCDCSARI